jgi:hypothetical protein
VVFSIGVLAFGYLLFLGLVGWTGANMRAHLVGASDSLFPSALASQEANATFQKLTQDYKVAILTQNASLLDTAGEDAAEVAAELQTVREKNGAQSCVTAIDCAHSGSVYGPCHAVQGYLMATVKSLATQNASMTKALQDLNDTISKKDFVTELGAVADSTSLQRTLT